MKVIVVGGTGTIGKAVVKELGQRHQIIVASQRHGDIQLDIQDKTSIQKMYQAVGKFDALISTVGKVHFGEFAKMTADEYFIGLNDKLMGQVNLVLLGLPTINDNGSFTLTSGILNHDPIKFGASAAMVNGALEGFTVGAAIEMPRGVRINTVSPTVITESFDDYAEYFYGFQSVTAHQAALAYSKSVEGLQTGQIYKVGY